MRFTAERGLRSGPVLVPVLVRVRVLVPVQILVLVLVLVLVSLPGPVSSFSRGASGSSCTRMVPGHVHAHPHDPAHSHVTLWAGSRHYLPGHMVTVTVRSSRDFMGFLLQARSAQGPGVGGVLVGGAWTLTPPRTHTIRCVADGDTVTHSDKQLKRNLSFVWRAPERPAGDVRFYLTVVQSYFVYWTGIRSAVLHDGTRRWRGSFHSLQAQMSEEDPSLPEEEENTTSTIPPSTKRESTDYKRLATPSRFRTSNTPDSLLLLTNVTESTISTKTEEKSQNAPKEGGIGAFIRSKTLVEDKSTQTDTEDAKSDRSALKFSEMNESTVFSNRTKVGEAKMLRLANAANASSLMDLLLNDDSTHGHLHQEELKVTSQSSKFSPFKRIKDLLLHLDSLFAEDSTTMTPFLAEGTQSKATKSRTPTSSNVQMSSNGKDIKNTPLIDSSNIYTSSPGFKMTTISTNPTILPTNFNHRATNSLEGTSRHDISSSSTPELLFYGSKFRDKATPTVSKGSTIAPTNTVQNSGSYFNQSSNVKIIKEGPTIRSSIPSTVFESTSTELLSQNTTFPTSGSTNPSTVFASTLRPESRTTQSQNTVSTNYYNESTKFMMKFLAKQTNSTIFSSTFGQRSTTLQETTPNPFLVSSRFSPTIDRFEYFTPTILSTSTEKSTSERETLSPRTLFPVDSTTASTSQSPKPSVSFPTKKSYTNPLIEGSTATTAANDDSFPSTSSNTRPVSPIMTSSPLTRGSNSHPTSRTVSTRQRSGTGSERSTFDLKNTSEGSNSESFKQKSGIKGREMVSTTQSTKVTPNLASRSKTQNQKPTAISKDATFITTTSTISHSSVKFDNPKSPKGYKTSTFVPTSPLLVSTSLPTSVNSEIRPRNVQKGSAIVTSALKATSRFRNSTFQRFWPTLQSKTTTIANFPKLPTQSPISSPPNSVDRTTSKATSTSGLVNFRPSAARRSFLNQISTSAPTLAQKPLLDAALSNPNSAVSRISQNGDRNAKPKAEVKAKLPPYPDPDREGEVPDVVPRHSAWELGMLLGCSAGLGMVLVVGLRYVYRQACGRRTQVTLHDREREYDGGRGQRGLIHVQECGDLVRVRRLRDNSFVLLAEYDILATPGD